MKAEDEILVVLMAESSLCYCLKSYYPREDKERKSGLMMRYLILFPFLSRVQKSDN